MPKPKTTIGTAAYLLREQNRPWYDIAKELYPQALTHLSPPVRYYKLAHRAKMAARDHALRAGKPWPVRLGKN